MIVLDTHAWIWLLSNPERLSKPARESVDANVTHNSVYVSCISAWEVALLTARGRLELALPVREWIDRSEGLSFLNFVPVVNDIAVSSVQLPEPLHSDPADRIIISTARALGAPLVTIDRKIRDYPHVRTIW